MRGDLPPTARQIYALAAAFCAREGIEWPRNRAEASALVGALRRETGHPRPELADTERRPGRRPRRRRYEEWELHHEIADVFPRRPTGD